MDDQSLFIVWHHAPPLGTMKRDYADLQTADGKVIERVAPHVATARRSDRADRCSGRTHRRRPCSQTVASDRRQIRLSDNRRGRASAGGVSVAHVKPQPSSQSFQMLVEAPAELASAGANRKGTLVESVGVDAWLPAALVADRCLRPAKWRGLKIGQRSLRESRPSKQIESADDCPRTSTLRRKGLDRHRGSDGAEAEAAGRAEVACPRQRGWLQDLELR